MFWTLTQHSTRKNWTIWRHATTKSSEKANRTCIRGCYCTLLLPLFERVECCLSFEHNNGGRTFFIILVLETTTTREHIGYNNHHYGNIKKYYRLFDVNITFFFRAPYKHRASWKNIFITYHNNLLSSPLSPRYTTRFFFVVFCCVMLFLIYFVTFWINTIYISIYPVFYYNTIIIIITAPSHWIIIIGYGWTEQYYIRGLRDDLNVW